MIDPDIFKSGSSTRGSTLYLRQLYREQPELFSRVMEEGLREAYAKHGGRPEKLHVELKPNDEKLRGPDEHKDRPQGYAYLLKLTFDAAPDEYEVCHTTAVREFAQTIEDAWESRSPNHKPGHYYPPQLAEHANCELSLTHLDPIYISNIVNRVMRANHLPTVDARIMGSMHPDDRGQGFVRS